MGFGLYCFAAFLYDFFLIGSLGKLGLAGLDLAFFQIQSSACWSGRVAILPLYNPPL